ncbi:U3 small nucleolar RNA-associated protein [Taphrina deformans PYCC 5710]|uniref:U3 small nucleolar RNA-associated protein n=1 Tax=Taphrina deformans (strain PYCC 5710 / ATCC 11124 / CBS 356.35 / IMI 108563 / JCM 9778 / NBRC 8474) TaxID=1097556 RepID=R4X6S8_TAPDE|nr:U3 small nucleolar RNA-associated protein [Taphrina deformans PYCC 5710]|eukprot:CCG80636.1 U3 small nucleolar RNA-associated protein [Taphrina deformans PYCC 5710]
MARTKPPKQSFAKDSQVNGFSSAVLLTAFHSSLPLFASALLSLDAWHIRIEDPSTSTSRNEYALDKGSQCRCLAWGSLPNFKKSEKSKKKRKVEDSYPDAVLAAGTNDGSIYLFNPSESDSLARLQGGHLGEILALMFSNSSLWSAGADGKLCEWDLTTHKTVQTITIDIANPLQSIAISPTDILAASYTIHHLQMSDHAVQNTYTNHTSPVHTILFGPDRHFISAADDDRYMNVFTMNKSTQDKALIAESDVRRITYSNDILCAVTADGVVELFPQPLAATTASTSKRRKSHVAGSKSIIKVVRPDATSVNIVDASLRSNNTMILVWNEGAKMVFETLSCHDDNGEIIESKEIVRSKQPSMGTTNGTKDNSRKGYADGNAQVVSGNDMRDLEMTDTISNGHPSGEDDSEDEAEPTEEPTLAERLHSMEVSAATPAKVPAASKAVMKMPPAGSLATVLTQALKSSDTALLESCLHHADSKVILATVRRLDATLAVTLLEQLASRISRRPGRSTDLGVWVRWTIVVHGGYLASLPGLVKTLSSLHSVLSTRAAALPRLLALQGRLDMVNSQIELRREGGSKTNTGEDPSDVEYVEGESDISDEEEIGIEDASQMGDMDTSDEESEAGSGSDEEGDFSDDSGDANEFAELDAQMEMMQDDEEGEDEEEVEGASDDEA